MSQLRQLVGKPPEQLLQFSWQPKKMILQKNLKKFEIKLKRNSK